MKGSRNPPSKRRAVRPAGHLRLWLAFGAGLGTAWLLRTNTNQGDSPQRAEDHDAEARCVLCAAPDGHPDRWSEELRNDPDTIVAAGRGSSMGRMLERIENASLDDIPRLITELQRPGNPRRRALELDLLMYRWAELNPEAAFAYVQSREAPERRALIGAVFEAWAAGAPADARDAFARLEPNGVQEAAFQGLVAGWVSADPAGAIAHLLRLNSRNLINEAPAVLVETLWQRNPGEAVEHVSRMGAGALRDGACRHVARLWAAREPNAAAQWAVQLGDSSSGLGAIREVAHAWTGTDPEAAAAWAASLSQGRTRRAAVAEVAQTWARQSPLAAAEWLSVLPPSEHYDAGVAEYARSITRQFPETAATWALTIDNDQLRTSVVSDVLDRWVHREPNAAIHWLRENNPERTP